MPASTANEYFEYWSPDDIQAEGQPFYVGYEENITTAIRLAEAGCGDESAAMYSFAFGFPGTGKSSFFNVAAWRLNDKLEPFEAIKVNCLYVANAPSDEARRVTATIDDLVYGRPDSPIFVMFDEADAVPRRPGVLASTQSEYTTTHWLMGMLKRLKDAGRSCLVIAVSNYPDLCDATIISEIGSNIYFGPPTKSDLVEILDDAGIAEPKLVAESYLSMCEKDEAVPMVRKLKDAIRLCKSVYRGAVAASTPKEMASRLRAGAFLERRTDLARYEKELARRRESARELQELLGVV